MTFLTHSAPLAIRHLRLPRLRLPKLGFAVLSTSIMLAYRMAYVEPFKTRERQPLISNDADSEGRDPHW